jgi:hypothetical protein
VNLPYIKTLPECEHIREPPVRVRLDRQCAGESPGRRRTAGGSSRSWKPRTAKTLKTPKTPKTWTRRSRLVRYDTPPPRAFHRAAYAVAPPRRGAPTRPRQVTPIHADQADAEVQLLDGGHFLLESALDEAAGLIRTFLGSHLKER